MRSRLHIAVVVLGALAACRKPAVPPTASIAGDAERSVAVGVAVALDGSASARGAGPGAEPALAALRFRWTLATRPGGSGAELATPGSAKSWLVPDAAGDYEAQLSVFDGTLWSAPATVRVRAGCLHAPTVQAAAQPAAPQTGQPVQLSAVVADEDATCPGASPRVLEFSWSLEKVPAGSGAAIADTGASTPNFVPDLPGSYLAVLRATDETGLTGRGEVEIVAGACGGAAPRVDSITAEPATPLVGEPVELFAVVSDADNAAPCSLGQDLALRWRFASLPQGSRAQLDRPDAAAPQFVPDVAGTYLVSLTVTDSTGRTGQGGFSIVVPDCGRSAPRVTLTVANPPATTTGGVVALGAAVDDADALAPCGLAESHTLEYRIADLPAGSEAALSDPLADAPWFRADRPGTYRVEVVATDASGLESAPASLEVTASACGDARPEVTLTATENGVGAPVQLDAAGTDADTQAPCSALADLSWKWWIEALPPGASAVLHAAEGARPWFVPDRPGTYVVRAVATDASARPSEAAEAVVQVSACGSARPSVTASALPSPATVGATVVASASAADDDGLAPCSRAVSFDYGWWFEEVPPGSEAQLNDPALREPSFVADAPGTYRLRVVAADETGQASEPAEVEITVDACGGAAPSVAPTATPADPGVGAAVALDAVADDADAQPPCNGAPRLTYRWWIEQRPAASAAELNAPFAATPTLFPDAPGKYVLRVVAQDETGRESAAGRVEIAASACGAGVPTVAPNASTASPRTGQAVTLDAGGGDPDAQAPCSTPATLAYRWGFVSLPAASRAALDDSRRANPSFTPDAPGPYVLAVSATDETARTSATGLVTVTAAVCGSASPLAVPSQAPANPAVGDTIRVDAGASDSDSGCGATALLSYRWWFEELPSGSRARLSSAALAAPSFLADQPGNYVLRVEVTDETGRSSGPVPLTVNVSSCGSNPPTAATPISTPASPPVGVPVQLSLTADDADISVCGLAGQLSTRWHFTSLPAGSRAALNDPSLARPSFIPDVSGAYVLGAVVTDSTGRSSAPVSLTVTATACGEAAPTASLAVSPSTAAVDQPVLFTATLGDTDNGAACLAQGVAFQPLRPLWRLVESPPPFGGSGDRPPLDGNTVTFSPWVSGTYVLEVTAEDPTGRRSAPARATLTVAACGDNRPQAFINQIVAGTCAAQQCGSAVPDLDIGGVTGCAGAGATTLQFEALCSRDPDNAAACTPLNQSLDYQWYVLQAPAGEGAQPQPSTDGRSVWFQTTAGATGDYRLGLRVNDSTGRESAQATVHFSVAVLGAPTRTYPQTNAAINTFSPSMRMNNDASAVVTFRPDESPDGTAGAHVRVGKCTGTCDTASQWTTAAVDCAVSDGPSLNRFSDDPLSYQVGYIRANEAFYGSCTGAACFDRAGAGCLEGVGSTRTNVTGASDAAELETALAQSRTAGLTGSNNLWLAYQAGTTATPPLGVAFCPGGGACAWCVPAGGGRIDTTTGTTGSGDFSIGLHAAPDGATADVLTAAYRRVGGDGNGDLVFATCRNTTNTCAAQCLTAANWTRVTVDGGFDRGRYAAIWRTPCNAPDQAGRIHISYIEGPGDSVGAKNIRYATCLPTGATCPQIGTCTNAANWTNVVVTTMPDGVPGTSMHVSPLDGLARIASHHHTGSLGLRLLTNRLSPACVFDANNWATTDVVCGNAGHEPSVFVHTDGKTRVSHSQGTGPPYDLYFYSP